MFHAWCTQTCAKCGSSFVIQSASCAASKNLSWSCRSLARIHSMLEINPRKPPSAIVVNASIGGAFVNPSTRVNPSRSRSWFSERCVRLTPPSKTTASASSRIFLRRRFICRKSSGFRVLGSGLPARGASPQPGTRNLELGTDFSLVSLRRRQFAAVEDKNSERGKDAAEDHHDLHERNHHQLPRNAP